MSHHDKNDFPASLHSILLPGVAVLCILRIMGVVRIFLISLQESIESSLKILGCQGMRLINFRILSDLIFQYLDFSSGFD